MFWITNRRAFFTSPCNPMAGHDSILNLRRFITGLVVVFVIIIGRYIVCRVSLLRCSSVKTKRSWVWKQTMGVVLINIIFIWSSICRLMSCGRGFYWHRKRTSGLKCVHVRNCNMYMKRSCKKNYTLMAQSESTINNTPYLVPISIRRNVQYIMNTFSENMSR